MSIDETGEYWIGTEAGDIDGYLRAYTADGHPVDRIIHATCPCGHNAFRLLVDADQGCAQRACSTCSRTQFVCDSAEHWAEAEPEQVTCPCGADSHEVAVGFNHREDGSAKWIFVGVRCVSCGVLGAVADWKIDYAPTDHLYALV
jgi:hypothetical protein